MLAGGKSRFLVCLGCAVAASLVGAAGAADAPHVIFSVDGPDDLGAPVNTIRRASYYLQATRAAVSAAMDEERQEACAYQGALVATGARILRIAFDTVDGKITAGPNFDSESEITRSGADSAVLFAASMPITRCADLKVGEPIWLARIDLEVDLEAAPGGVTLRFVDGLRPSSRGGLLEAEVVQRLWLRRNGAGAPASVAVSTEELQVLTRPGVRFLRGNANNDGNVDIADSTFMLNYLFVGGSRFACAKASDFNDDGRIDIADPIALLNFQFLGGQAPRAPYPGCGIDPTQDRLGCDDFNSCVGGGDASGQARLSWERPRTSADGSPLFDLAGFTIYYGPVPRQKAWFGVEFEPYPFQAQIGNSASYTLTGLPARRLYFAVTAYDRAGNESDFSPEASKLFGSPR
jgi:hypothetical protein